MALAPERAASGPRPACAALGQHRRACRSSPQRCRLQGRCDAAPAATTALTAEAEAIRTASAAAARIGGWLLPPVTDQPGQLLRREVPFLTRQAGALPVKPASLDHALHTYGSYSSKYVSVRVENVHVKLSSWDHAVESLAGAEAGRRPYWCSLLERVQHPAWWPASGHVPTYDQVIFGRGNASIGLHFDKDNACAGGSRRPVCTYLAICEGCKLTLLLPPDQTLLPPGGDPELLLRPPPGFLEAVRDAGGYYFLLQDPPPGCPTAAAGPASSSSSNSSSGSSSSSRLSTLDPDWRSNWRSLLNSRPDAMPSSSTSSTSGSSGSAYADGGPSSAEAFAATALYMPSGWYHWLVGLSDWHVVYGGSFYPEEQGWRQN